LKRDGVVLYPPVDLSKYKFKEFGDFYLHIGRFDPEKRIRMVVDACLKSKRKLVLIGGEGRDKDTLNYVKKLSNSSPYIEYLGYVDGGDKRRLLSECRAVIYPPISEDFGIVPIEALASGKPIIVSNSGFPELLVRQKGCGVVCEPSADSLVDGIKQIENIDWDPSELMKKSEEFDFSKFKERLLYWMKRWHSEFREFWHGEVL